MRSLVLPVACCLGGCANINSVYRPISIGASENGQAVALDIKQRAIFSMPREVTLSDESTVRTVVVCAEPSPDALSAYSASAGAGLANQTGTSTQAAFAAGEASGSVGLRTQSIQLLRDGLFSNCLSYMGGGLKPNEFYELQRRSQNFTLGLLAIEQLTGVVKADQVALNTAAATATGSDNTDKESSALDEAKAEQNEALTSYEKGKIDLAAARKAVSDQEAKVASAQKIVSNPAKDATDASKKEAQDVLDTEKSTLETRRREADVLRVEVDALARAATNADSRVAAAQSMLLMAQSRVRASAAGTASIARAGGVAAAVTQHVSEAVVSIVSAVLAESGKGEQCNAMLGRAHTIRNPEDLAQALAAACSKSEAATLQTLLNVTVPAGTSLPQDAEKLRQAVERSNVYRATPSKSLPRPTPSPPPPAAPAPAASSPGQ